MEFRNITVKELFDNEETAAVIKELAPQLLKYPIKLFYKKTCGEVFLLVTEKGLIPPDKAAAIEAAIMAK